RHRRGCHANDHRRRKVPAELSVRRWRLGQDGPDDQLSRPQGIGGTKMRKTFKQLPGIFALIFSLLATAACAADTAPAAARQWTAGSDYLVLDPPQPTSTGGKIEVV